MFIVDVQFREDVAHYFGIIYLMMRYFAENFTQNFAEVSCNWNWLDTILTKAELLQYKLEQLFISQIINFKNLVV